MNHQRANGSVHILTCSPSLNCGITNRFAIATQTIVANPEAIHSRGIESAARVRPCILAIQIAALKPRAGIAAMSTPADAEFALSCHYFAIPLADESNVA